MTVPRRILGTLALALLAGGTGLGVGACARNELAGAGLDQYILVQGASPIGRNSFAAPESAYRWAVNSIDSVVFINNIDSTALAVTTLQVYDSTGRLVPGTVRFMPGNAMIHLTEDWPSLAYAFSLQRGQTAGRSIGKVYFIPDAPFAAHRSYRYVLTTGVRKVAGGFARDHQEFWFTTGDSVPSPNPIWPLRETDFQ